VEVDGDVSMALDACNLGGGGTYLTLLFHAVTGYISRIQSYVTL